MKNPATLCRARMSVATSVFPCVVGRQAVFVSRAHVWPPLHFLLSTSPSATMCSHNRAKIAEHARKTFSFRIAPLRQASPSPTRQVASFFVRIPTQTVHTCPNQFSKNQTIMSTGQFSFRQTSSKMILTRDCPPRQLRNWNTRQRGGEAYTAARANGPAATFRRRS